MSDAGRLPPIMRRVRRDRSPSPSVPRNHSLSTSSIPNININNSQSRENLADGRDRSQSTGVDGRSVQSQNSLHSTGSFRLDESEDDMDSYYPPAHSINPPLYYTPHMEDKMKRKLKFHFMNPYEKFKARRQCPWKLGIQVVKVVLVTVQLIMFGTFMASHINFIEKSSTAFKHLYLKNWDPSFETMPYPPATGVFAIYTIPEFYDSVNYALERYNETEKLAIGTYHYAYENNSKPAMELCKNRYKIGKIFAYNETYIYDSTVIEDCILLGPVEYFNETTNSTQLKYDTEKYLKDNNRTIQFDRVITIDLKFSLKTVHLKGLSKVDKPDCYRFDIKIHYDNLDHNGQMQINLILEEIPLDCNGEVVYHSNGNLEQVLTSVFDTIVMLISIVSCSLCIRSIFRAQKLRKETVRFFKHHFDKDLSLGDKMEFMDMWYVLIIINDLLTVSGSIIKIQIENKTSFHYDVCGMLLGIGNLFVWIGVLRYLGFFDKYNILILTLKKSAPFVFRFLMCAAVFYMGFTFCGWVVLGPYHIKFRSISTASECLFSLVNGDDMFVTFSAITNNKQYIWWFSRIFLYSFISLFIYVVLSVFISVIMDSYETIKYCYENGFPKSELMEFIDSCTDESDSPLYRSDSQGDNNDGCHCNILQCCRRPRNGEANEQTGLIS